MGLFKKKPQTIEEKVDYILTEKKEEKVSAAQEEVYKSISGTIFAVSRRADYLTIVLPILAWIANRTVESARTDMNRLYALKIVAGNLQESTDREFIDVYFSHPDEFAAVEKAIFNLYQNGGNMVHDAIRYMARDKSVSKPDIGIIDETFLRPVFAETLESPENRKEFYSWSAPWWGIPQKFVKTGEHKYYFPIFDYIIRHRNDIAPETVEEFKSLFKKKVLAEIKVFPDYFKEYYLRYIGREDDADLVKWFVDTFCTE